MLRSLLPMFVVAGCAPIVEVAWLNAPPRELHPREAASVELLTGGPPTDRSYVEVAFVTVRPQESTDLSGLLELMRERAGRIGCDAIVVKTVRQDIGPMSGTCLMFRERPILSGP